MTDTLRREGDTSKTINAEFEVDPERNGGAAFPHKDVVRNKAERQRMYAFDCACCAEVSPLLLERHAWNADTIRQWYEAVGPGVTDAERDAAHQAHLQQTSRHRAYGPPSSTPPAYWCVAVQCMAEMLLTCRHAGASTFLRLQTPRTSTARRRRSTSANDARWKREHDGRLGGLAPMLTLSRRSDPRFKRRLQ